MKRIPFVDTRRIRAVAIVLVLVLPAAVQATGLRNERAATDASAAVVSQAARGELDAAFADAARLGQERDAALPAVLDRQKQAAGETLARLGAVRSVSAPDEQFFAGCVTRSYLLRHAGGTSRWMLKWRRGNGGWYLNDLAVSRS